MCTYIPGNLPKCCVVCICKACRDRNVSEHTEQQKELILLESCLWKSLFLRGATFAIRLPLVLDISLFLSLMTILMFKYYLLYLLVYTVVN